MTATGGSDRPTETEVAEMMAAFDRQQEAMARLGPDSTEEEVAAVRADSQELMESLMSTMGIRAVEPGDVLPPVLRSLYDALTRAADDGARLELDGEQVEAVDLLCEVDDAAAQLLAAGTRPFDWIRWPALDRAGLGMVLGALSIGVNVADREPIHEGPWRGTLADAREVRGGLFVGPDHRRILEQELKDGMRPYPSDVTELVPPLVRAVGAALTPWAEPAEVYRDVPLGEGWDTPGMTVGEPTVPDGCVGVTVWSAEYGCCGPSMVVGQRVSWDVVWRPPHRWPAMAFHLDVPAPEPVAGVVEAIFVLRDEYAPLGPREEKWWGDGSAGGVGYRRTGRRAYRSVMAYPNRRWSGNLLVVVRPAG